VSRAEFAQLVEKFLALFHSNDESFVARDRLGAVSADGKVEARYVTYSIDSEKSHLRRSLAAADVESHLTGKICLVLKPELSNGTCWWAASDYDVYQNEGELKRILAAAKREKLPLTFFTSKSGGLHGVAFFSAPVPVERVRLLLQLYNEALDRPDAEIFPKPVAPGKKPFGVAVPFFGEPERFKHFTPNRINLSANGNGPTNANGGGLPDYLRVEGREPEGFENVGPTDVSGPPGIPLPPGVDFEKLLQTGRGLKFNLREERSKTNLNYTTETSFDYHGINGQPCLIQGTVHEANRANPRCSRFVVHNGAELINGERMPSVVSHQCFDSDCRGVSGSRTLKALSALGIDLDAAGRDARIAAATPPDQRKQYREHPHEVETAASIAAVEYPVEVWDGTLYGEYAKIATKGNFIPPEFFIESAKTVVGAIAGDRDGANLRQLTVIVGVVGKGKGTAARNTQREFRGLPEENEEASADLLRNETVESIHQHIGAVLANSASEVGLYRSAKACERVLLTPTEFSEFLAKMKIENSALSSNIRELFDTSWFTPTTSAKRESKNLPTRCLLSLLSTTQRKTLETALSTQGGLGEGLESRITWIYNEERRTVAALEKPQLDEWRKKLFAKLLALENDGQAFVFDRGAIELLNVWWKSVQQAEEQNDEIITRLNVLALRNALHLAWLRTEPGRSTTWKVERDDVAKAIRLGDYQLATRRFLIVGEADNPIACQQEKIRAYLRRHGPSTFREIKKGRNAARVGTEIHKRALVGLIDDDEVVREETERKNSPRFHLAKET